jgi:hypothetical protein
MTRRRHTQEKTFKEPHMAAVSDLVLSYPEINSFAEFKRLVIALAKSGEIFLEFDVKPDYPDTPRKWQYQLEAAFYRGEYLDEED